MTSERLAELRSKVEHGYNLLASEAREVFEHYGDAVERKRTRCNECHGEGGTRLKSGLFITCDECEGTGYEPLEQHTGD